MLDTRDVQSACLPAGTDNNLVPRKPLSGRSHDGSFVNEAAQPDIFLDNGTGPLDLAPERRTCSDFMDDLGNAAEQRRIVERRLSGSDAIDRQLRSIAHEPRRMGKGPDR